MRRLSWDSYFIAMCKTVGKRATCDRGRNACVIVKDKHILSTGYVGAPPGMPHCDEAGHLLRYALDAQGRRVKHCIRTVHAEQNAIAQAARYGIALEDATLYTLMTPCLDCAKLLLSVGIKRVVSERRYHADEEALEILKKAGVEIVVLKKEVVKY